MGLLSEDIASLEGQIDLFVSECTHLDIQALGSRYEVLRGEIADFFERNTVEYWFRGGGDEKVKFTAGDLTARNLQWIVIDSDSDVRQFIIRAGGQMDFIRLILSLRENVGYLDEQAIEANKERYGAKAANLIELQKLIERISEPFRKTIDGWMKLAMPEFVTIPVGTLQLNKRES